MKKDILGSNRHAEKKIRRDFVFFVIAKCVCPICLSVQYLCVSAPCVTYPYVFVYIRPCTPPTPEGRAKGCRRWPICESLKKNPKILLVFLKRTYCV